MTLMETILIKLGIAPKPMFDTILNMGMATTTPPFGLGLFVMKGVAPPDTTMGDIYRAAIPFLICDAVAMGLVMAFPMLALWLPELMR